MNTAARNVTQLLGLSKVKHDYKLFSSEQPNLRAVPPKVLNE